MISIINMKTERAIKANQVLVMYRKWHETSFLNFSMSSLSKHILIFIKWSVKNVHVIAWELVYVVLFFIVVFVDGCDDKLANYDFMTPLGCNGRLRERTIDATWYNWFERFFLCVDLKLGWTFSHLNNLNGFSQFNANDIVNRNILICLSIIRHNIYLLLKCKWLNSFCIIRSDIDRFIYIIHMWICLCAILSQWFSL